jgi:putative transposase
MSGNKVYLFIHAICTVKNKEVLLTRPVRTVLFSHIKKHGEENGIKVLIVNGVDDHVHILLQLMPTQNLTQVMKSLRADAASWINESRFLKGHFEWDDDLVALSVSPSSVKQVMEFIEKQEEHHKTKSLESELEVFQKIQY